MVYSSVRETQAHDGQRGAEESSGDAMGRASEALAPQGAQSGAGGSASMAVRVVDARKHFGSFAALRGVSLDVPHGSLTSVLGPSGCGKTTLLRSIAGLEALSAGEIWLAGERVAGSGTHVPAERRNVGLVFQSYAIWPHMTVFENVAFGLRLARVPKKEIGERVGHVLETVGMEEFASRPATDLSGGQQQRVAIARSVVTEPALLLFDEPLSNLDAKLRDRMRYELQLMLERLRITSVYVTHDQSEAFALSDHVTVMSAGTIQQQGSPMEVYYNPANSFVAEFVGLTNRLVGSVVERDGEYATVRLDGGCDLRARVRRNARASDEVVLYIRPEAIRSELSPTGGVNEVRATVRQSSYLGSVVALYLEVGGQQVRVEVDPRQFYAAGEELPEDIWITLPPDQLVELPDVDEIR